MARTLGKISVGVVAGVLCAATSLGAGLVTSRGTELPDTSDTSAFTGNTVLLNCRSDSGSVVIDFDELIGGPAGDLADNLLNCPDSGANYVPLIGGSGNFEFSTNAGGLLAPNCSVSSGLETADADHPLTGEPNTPCTLGALGTYRNFICGNAVLFGIGTLTENVDGEQYGASFTAVIAGGSGPVMGTITSDTANLPDLADDQGDMLSGWIQLVPRPSGGPPACTSQVSVIGNLSITSPN